MLALEKLKNTQKFRDEFNLKIKIGNVFIRIIVFKLLESEEVESFWIFLDFCVGNNHEN